jgi:hypothetical protein
MPIQLTERFRQWRSQRHREREAKALAERWPKVIAACVEAGANYAAPQDRRGGIAVLEDVPARLHRDIEALGFRRLHADSAMWTCPNPLRLLDAPSAYAPPGMPLVVSGAAQQPTPRARRRAR